MHTNPGCSSHVQVVQPEARSTEDDVGRPEGAGNQPEQRIDHHTLAAISSMCLITDRVRSRHVDGDGSPLGEPARSVARCVGGDFPLDLKISHSKHPTLGEVEVDRGESRDDHHQQPGHGGGIAHLELDEPALVEVQRVEQRLVGRAAGPLETT